MKKYKYAHLPLIHILSIKLLLNKYPNVLMMFRKVVDTICIATVYCRFLYGISYIFTPKPLWNYTNAWVSLILQNNKVPAKEYFRYSQILILQIAYQWLGTTDHCTGSFFSDLCLFSLEIKRRSCSSRLERNTSWQNRQPLSLSIVVLRINMYTCNSWAVYLPSSLLMCGQQKPSKEGKVR